MSEFNRQSTTDDVLQGINLSGKSIVVTGATSGLGEETARALAAAGANICLVGRDQPKLHALQSRLNAQYPTVRVTTAVADLADQNSVRIGAASILAQHDAIDVLINNAGIMACPKTFTAQGLEAQFGTNHIGHFLLTGLLLPALLKSTPSRIVCLSSAAHHMANIDLDDPCWEHREYDKWRAYGAAKTANALHALALNARLAKHGVAAFSVHPGVIETNLMRHLGEQELEAVKGRMTRAYKTIAQGAATSVWAATAAELDQHGGAYLENCQVAGAPDEAGNGAQPWIQDIEAADRLWSLSEHIVGECFN